ncbi:MAG: hypothetical protein RBG13Loki_3922 [Promethearchaeota archaeon CR_4]|nr:MAG: hypothetical protein RBG13Loki_3922 [Candidatus Lokiarchaeota archaeon CR_4]
MVTYDARGVGESRRVGNKNDFSAQIWEDFPRVITFLQTHPVMGHLPMAVVGFSMGASSAMIGGILNSHVRVVIAVSALSDQNINLPWIWNPFNPRFWLRIRYTLLGLSSNLPAEVNTQISPVVALSEVRARSTPEEWERIVKKRLYLVHCTNDKPVRVEHFHNNRNALAIPLEQSFLLSRGGHTYLRAELFLGSILLRILDANLAQSMKLNTT